MKTKIPFILIALSLLVSVVGMAATSAAPLTKTAIKSVTLIRTTFVEEKGMFFEFKITGTFQEKDLKGFLLVDGKTIKLSCRSQKSETQAQCTAPGGTSANYSGQSAILDLNGYRFWVTIPNKKKECPNCAGK